MGVSMYLTQRRREKKISERELAQRLGIARETLRRCELNPEHSNVGNLIQIAKSLDLELLLALIPNQPPDSKLSIVGVSHCILIDGFESWKIHMMNFVDEFRRTKDVRLILLPPLCDLDLRLQSLLASVVVALCFESQIDVPEWAAMERYLEKPWFVAGIESLKASALLETPTPFRRNNIFVLENFLQRV
jgi:transcriptional regulator with XRE-family HTH domain